jgi:pimeloyl-ACP methyl ester carboxylesterase
MPPLAGPGTPPAEALGEGLLRMQRLGRHWRAAWLVMAAMRQGTRFGLFKPHKVIDAASNPRDAACLTPALRRDLIAAWREGLRTGVAGAVSDARIYATGWGFDFTAITAPVSIWHGSADIVIPPATLCAWDGMTAQRHVLEGEGHYSLALTRTPDVIAGLIV